MSELPAIAVDKLSVSYRAPLERKATLKSTLTRRGDSLPPRRIEAVRDVSFSVPHGGVFGVIGANGAGKTTLLRALAGILPPAAGRVTIRGRVTALLALGVGFQPELSGRDNAMLGGLASGLAPAAARRCVEDIMDFADLGEFSAYPMKTYSSGMQARLAFSVAVHVDPDVLLIDEALSTGDAAFRIKANAKMEELCAASAGHRCRVPRARCDQKNEHVGVVARSWRRQPLGRPGRRGRGLCGPRNWEQSGAAVTPRWIP